MFTSLNLEKATEVESSLQENCFWLLFDMQRGIGIKR